MECLCSSEQAWSIHTKKRSTFPEVFHNLETGDMILFSAENRVIRWFTRAHATHVAMVVRKSDMPQQLSHTRSMSYSKGVHKSYSQLRKCLHECKLYPKICPRDCLNDLMLIESTNHTEHDLELKTNTTGCHLVNLFDKLSQNQYDWIAVRYLLSRTSDSSRVRQVKDPLMRERIWEYIMATRGKPYDANWNNLLSTVHKSFSWVSLQPPEHASSQQETGSIKHRTMLEIFSETDSFFCSSLISGMLCYLQLLDSTKMNYVHYSPGDFMGDHFFLPSDSAGVKFGVCTYFKVPNVYILPRSASTDSHQLPDFGSYFAKLNAKECPYVPQIDL